MNISESGGGTMLFFSQEELAAAQLSPDCLTQAQALQLVRGALAEALQPIPPAMELTIFPSRQGALFFVLPRLTHAEEGRRFSVAFS